MQTSSSSSSSASIPHHRARAHPYQLFLASHRLSNLKAANDDVENEDVTCAVCKQIYLEPYIFCEEGHTFCRSCVQDRPSVVKCPKCRKSLLNTPIRDLTAANILATRTITCSNKGVNPYQSFIEAAHQSGHLPLLIAYQNSLPILSYRPPEMKIVEQKVTTLPAEKNAFYYIQSIIYGVYHLTSNNPALDILDAYRIVFKGEMVPRNAVCTIEDLCNCAAFLYCRIASFDLSPVLGALYIIMMQLCGGVILFDPLVQQANASQEHVQAVWCAIVKMIFMQEQPIECPNATVKDYENLTSCISNSYISYIVHLISCQQDKKIPLLKQFLEPILLHESRENCADQFFLSTIDYEFLILALFQCRVTTPDGRNPNNRFYATWLSSQLGLDTNQQSANTTVFPALGNICQWSGTLDNYRKHTDKDCLFEEVDDCDCKVSVTRLQSRNHKLFVCKNTMITCSYPRCKDTFSRNSIAQHLTECPKRRVPCKFSYVGCTFVGPYDHINEPEAMHQHIDLLESAYIQQKTASHENIDPSHL